MRGPAACSGQILKQSSRPKRRTLTTEKAKMRAAVIRKETPNGACGVLPTGDNRQGPDTLCYAAVLW